MISIICPVQGSRPLPLQLFLDPVLLHLRRLILVVVASFAMDVHFLHPLLPVFTGPSIPEPLHDGTLNSLAPGKFPHPGIKFSSTFVVFSEIFLQDWVPTFRSRRRHPPKHHRDVECVLVRSRRRCRFDRRRIFQRFLQEFKSSFLSIAHPSPSPLWTSDFCQKLQFLFFRLRNPPCSSLFAFHYLQFVSFNCYYNKITVQIYGPVFIQIPCLEKNITPSHNIIHLLFLCSMGSILVACEILHWRHNSPRYASQRSCNPSPAASITVLFMSYQVFTSSSAGRDIKTHTHQGSQDPEIYILHLRMQAQCDHRQSRSPCLQTFSVHHDDLAQVQQGDVVFLVFSPVGQVNGHKYHGADQHCFFEGFETQTAWLHADKGVLERLWLEEITAHRRRRERNTSFRPQRLVLTGGAQPSFQPADKTQETTKIEGLRQAYSHFKEWKRTSKTTHFMASPQATYLANPWGTKKVRGLLPSSWRYTGVELDRADSRHSKGERQHWRPGDGQGDPPECLSSVAVLASASQRSPRCARVSDSPQVGKKGAQ